MDLDFSELQKKVAVLKDEVSQLEMMLQTATSVSIIETYQQILKSKATLLVEQESLLRSRVITSQLYSTSTTAP